MHGEVPDYRRAGRTVVIVSHAMGLLRNFCDHVTWLEHGRLQAVGPAGSVVDDYVDETHAERGVTPADGADDARWGSGEIRVERVEVLDASGTDTRTLRTGDEVVVRLHYRAAERVERPVFGIGITTLEGHDVTGPNTRDTDDVPDALEGVGHVDFRVDRLALLPGTYELTAAVYDYTCQHPFDHRHRLVRFDVVPGVPREGVGVVSLGGAWRYSESDVSAALRRTR